MSKRKGPSSPGQFALQWHTSSRASKCTKSYHQSLSACPFSPFLSSLRLKKAIGLGVLRDYINQQTALGELSAFSFRPLGYIFLRPNFCNAPHYTRRYEYLPRCGTPSSARTYWRPKCLKICTRTCNQSYDSEYITENCELFRNITYGKSAWTIISRPTSLVPKICNITQKTEVTSE